VEWLRQVVEAEFAWLSILWNDVILASINAVFTWIWESLLLPLLEWMLDWALDWLEDIADWAIAQIAALLGLNHAPTVRELIRDIWMFLTGILEELGLEFDSALDLFDAIGEVLGVLLTGWMRSLSGDTEADFGESLGGLAAYLWRGVRWVDETITDTPLMAVNLIAMGAIVWGLVVYTIAKFNKLADRFIDTLF